MDLKLGGPVWHASVKYNGRIAVPDEERMRHALKALRNVGDSAAGEWHESAPGAYHLRRRLTPTEQGSLTLRDVRGTREAETRWKVMPRQVREIVPQFVLDDELRRDVAQG